jgi:hypothetical protein
MLCSKGDGLSVGAKAEGRVMQIQRNRERRAPFYCVLPNLGGHVSVHFHNNNSGSSSRRIIRRKQKKMVSVPMKSVDCILLVIRHDFYVPIIMIFFMIYRRKEYIY